MCLTDTMGVDLDPVVKEIPVFLSKQLSECLYLLQYPLHPTNIPYDNVTHTRVGSQFLIICYLFVIFRTCITVA